MRLRKDRNHHRYPAEIAVSNERRWNFPLFEGEKYELVVTVKASGFGRLKRLVPSLTSIGRVRKGPHVVGASIAGRLLKVEPRDWEHFASQGRVRLA